MTRDPRDPAEAARLAASRRQNAASDPGLSAWVSAHAGSGKTHLLVNRIIRLMLAGAQPERILCLTYTRAAAAEMKQRLFRTLAGWITLDDAALKEAIGRMSNGEIRMEDDELARARRLFAQALETPGGLKAQTIHAFCERLLQAFPVEAGMAPGFQVLDEAAAAGLLAEARGRVLSGAAADGPDPAEVAEKLAVIAAHASEGGFEDLLSRLISHRLLLRRVAADPRRRADFLAHLAKLLGLPEGATDEETLTQRWFAALDRKTLRAAARHLADFPGKINNNQAARFSSLAAAGDARTARAAAKEAFLVKSGAPKADASILTKKAAKADPALAERLFAARKEFVALDDAVKAARIHRGNAALLDIGMAIIEEYDRIKARKGLSDYDDLIDAAWRLLSDDNVSSAWVRYRLDGGLDHVLVDEAQDTAPRQWEIIAALTEEFHAGEGIEHLLARTIFAVGDYKQSIYSFQGAQPDAFFEMRAFFRRRLEGAGRRLLPAEMNTSFRSTPAILEAVDMVFGSGEVDFGAEGAMPPHEPVRIGEGGLVELWPLEEAEEAPGGGDPWRAPKALEFREKARLRLARRMAGTIRGWLDNGEMLESEGRPIRADDILILLRTRSDFMDMIVSALKRRGIRVAGADRLKVAAHIAVQDMMALGRFALLPDDDLSLACVLKSPLLAHDEGRPFNDDDLLALRRIGERDDSLWRRLRAAPWAGRAVEALRGWRAMAGYAPPYEFFAAVLGRDGGRAAIVSRLGAEAEEPLDAFLDLARAHEREHAPSLSGFLEYLESADPEIKRDMEEGHGEVRVMTVHGAKGLQANVVFLPDTCSTPDKRRLDYLVVPPASPEEEEAPVWTFRSEERSAAARRMVERAHEKNMQEYNRLLYVAMTRARDRLHVCGAAGKNGPGPESWYRRIANHLAVDDHAVYGPDGALLCWRLHHRQARPVETAEARAARRPHPLPEWAREAPPAEAAPARWLAPSKSGREESGEKAGAGRAEAALSPLSGMEGKRFARGLLVHRLLQFLPDLEPEKRRERAIAWLVAPARGLSEAQARALHDEVAAIMADERCKALFGPGSRAEAPFAARVRDAEGAEILVSGQIDRLVVSAEEIIVADYKTSRPPPRRVEDVPGEYIRQLAIYRRAMRALWPGRPVRAVLVWTAAPSLMEIPARMLDEA